MKKVLGLLLFLIPFWLQAEIYTLRVDGPIDTLLEEYVVDSFKKIHLAGNASLVIIEMDTPGGYDTSMRVIIKAMLNAEIPVAVYVSPKGARAASAGFFLLLASDIAAMAPGTNTGAAHPVSVTGSDIEKTMKEKITNDAAAYVKTLAKNRGRNMEMAEKAVRESHSYTAEECLKNGLIDLIAADTRDLIDKLHGRTLTLANSREIILNLKNEKIISLKMSERQKFLRTITNPNLAYFLLIFGLIGLYIEFTHPGGVIPGILGGISLLLAFLAFQILPINYVGLFLILLSIGFFIAEIKIQGFGMLGVGGIVSFVLGSIMLINAPIPEMRPAMPIILTFAVCFGCIFLFLTLKVIQALKRRKETGREGLIGEMGVAKTDIDNHQGKVFVHGEWWNAVADGQIPAGSRIQVDTIDNLILKVKKSGG
ncbi:MAG: nodulation protein NfeD [Acidobacteria bacterium]|nr:nodulation protein NfeD [Acidobacteriota bacterium]MBU4307952.1 nodulation protein NfeD [Acidobacteriota bacterium]MCG2811798.1 nodulation protein NfeD [Candidatus Aminicenantes bacterium]